MYNVLSMCNSVILCDIARLLNNIASDQGITYKRQMLYNIPYHSATLPDEAPSAHLVWRREGRE